MGSLILKYTISLLLLFTASLAFAQKANKMETDTLEAEFMPSGVRIGIDALNLGLSIADDSYSSVLFVADVDIYRYFLVGEYGNYSRTRTGENGVYTTDGSYWRIGADINLFKKNQFGSVLSVGLRYGNSTFSDQLTTTLASYAYGTRQVTYQNEGVKGDWFEFVAGLKVPVWKLWLGYNLRMKMGIDSYEQMAFIPYEVPGYGLAAEKDYWEFNYYIMYRIEWR
ncbi:MAG: DUF6048 family protein [Candidatus Cyclobacteriaceae bacterium M2_1C_046]